MKAVANAVRSRIRNRVAPRANAQAHGLVGRNLFLCEDDERAVAEAAEENRSRARAGGVEHEHASNTPTPRFACACFLWAAVRRTRHGARSASHATRRRARRTSKPRFRSARPAGATGARRRKTTATLTLNARRASTSTRWIATTPWTMSTSARAPRRRLRTRRGSRTTALTTVYAVPYSEHSSFDELTAFVSRVKPVRITPTVNAQTDAEREKILRHFQHLTDASRDRNRLEHYFRSARKRRGRERRRVEGEERGGPRRASGGSGSRDPRRAPLDVDPRGAAAAGRAPGGSGAALKAGKVKKETGYGGPGTGDPSETPFPLGCVALVRGGGGGFGGGGPKYAQFRDKAHVESRLRALGATVVHRASPRDARRRARRWRGARRGAQAARAARTARRHRRRRARRQARFRGEARARGGQGGAAPERDDEKKKTGKKTGPARRVSRPGAYQTEVVTEGGG